MKDTKVIMATGISGCGRKEHLSRDPVSWESYCESRGKKVKVCHVGDKMFQLAHEMGLKLKRENILNADSDILNLLRVNIYKDILADLAENSYDAYVISVHGFFYWQSIFKRSYDRLLKSKFSPDMFVTFIDDFRRIITRLKDRPQWEREDLTPASILRWQNIEVDVTADWAEFAEKPFFAIATAEPVSTLYKLVFHPEIEPVYVAMPISHFREPKEREQINRFIERLNKYFAVFNPLSVEIVGAASVDDFHNQERQTINNHVAHRDLHWFVRQSDKIVVYWPGAIPSPGVSTETYEAFVKTKDVWVVYLGKEASPFITHLNTGLDQSEEEFFEFLDKKYPERKDLVW